MIHPIDYRYNTPEMRRLFEQEHVLQKRLAAEVALVRAHEKLKNIPKGSATLVEAGAKKVTLARVQVIEDETQHDLVAVVNALAEQSGKAAAYVHLGATSYDIIDTAWALLFRDAFRVFGKHMNALKKILMRDAQRYADAVMVARTHGQHALPTTLGLKYAVWLSEMTRHAQRLEELKPRILVGKLTGAVGTGAGLGRKATRLQSAFLKDLGLGEPAATTQVLQRDRHAEAIFFLVLVGQTLNKIAKEIRNLQRTEIAEVEEFFEEKKQIGSSAMPQKRNPWRAERICGITRQLRSLIIPALENIPLEHERDLTNSSVERMIIPEAFLLTDFALSELTQLLDNLRVNGAQMRKNLDMTQGRIMAESLMLALIDKGTARPAAHTLVRGLAMKSLENETPLEELARKNPKVREKMTEQEVSACFEPEKYVGAAHEYVNLTLKRAK